MTNDAIHERVSPIIANSPRYQAIRDYYQVIMTSLKENKVDKALLDQQEQTINEIELASTELAYKTGLYDGVKVSIEAREQK